MASLIEKILQHASVEWPGGAANARIKRTYVGCNQRSAGAWLWYLEPVDQKTGYYPEVGSSWRAKDVAKAKKITRLGGELIPD